MDSKKGKITNSILFKLWDYFVLLLVVVSIFFLIQAYFEISPEIARKKENVNLIISSIFLFDVIIRVLLFGKKYIYSLEFVIDILACSDIITPALRAVRGVKYTRLMRLMRLLRMLRIFRGLKAVKHVTQSPLEEKLFNFCAIFTILSFIFIAMFVTSFAEKKVMSITESYYKKLITTISLASNENRKGSDPELFSKYLRIHNEIAALHLKLKGWDEPMHIDHTTDKDFWNIYTPDDILEISFNETNYIKVLVKELKYYMTLLEFFILISSLPLVFILLSTMHVIIKKYHTDSLQSLSDKMDNYSARETVAISDNCDGIIGEIFRKYNEIILKDENSSLKNSGGEQ